MKQTLILASCIAFVVGCAPAEQQPAAVAPEGPEAAGLENGSFAAKLNGFEIHYEVHGQGPVLMTLPNSWGLSFEGLRALYRPLESRLTMVYFDPRGMGESAAVVEPSDMGMAAVRADFHALREHLGLESANVIGWSNGAMNLIYLAAERPETIDAAIFLHGAAKFDAEDNTRMMQQYPEIMQKYGAFLQEVQNPELTDDDRTAMMRSLWLDEWFPILVADQEAAPAILDGVFAEAEFSWPHSDYSNKESPVFDATDQLPLITARCLVIMGAADMIPPSKGQEMADAIADAQLEVFDNSAHFAPKEEAAKFEALVFDFLGAQ
ncbi:MAG: alpha/beta hydrolase [Holophagae bacterium]|jgi:pimeloyl-ACP methyl ester carboxylesterase